jgi:drug/metabolite transporter (DMT)-like permease
MSLWIIATLLAASFQTGRFMLQKQLAASALSATGATFARFLYSMPLVLGGLGAYLLASGHAVPALSAAFWAYGALGGLSQILATVCVVLLFKARNFAVGITFKKTEAILAVVVGLAILGEGVSWMGFAAILLGVVGVLMLSKPPDEAQEGLGWRVVFNRASGLGLASGLLFACSGVTYRAASLELGGEAPLFRAAVTLAAVVTMQCLGMLLWMAWRDRAEIRAVWAARRTAFWVGVLSLGGSGCWFLAFTLQTAAYVKALGQVELILSLMASALVFRERITRRELLGMAVLGASILLLVLVI